MLSVLAISVICVVTWTAALNDPSSGKLEQSSNSAGSLDLIALNGTVRFHNFPLSPINLKRNTLSSVPQVNHLRATETSEDPNYSFHRARSDVPRTGRVASGRWGSGNMLLSRVPAASSRFIVRCNREVRSGRLALRESCSGTRCVKSFRCFVVPASRLGRNLNMTIVN